MANVEAGLNTLRMHLRDRHDSDYVSFHEMLLVLKAMREPILNDDRPITRGQANKIIDANTVINRRLGEIESVIGGTKRKWRDEVDRRLDVLEGKPTSGYTQCVWTKDKKQTIEIDREIAEQWRSRMIYPQHIIELINSKLHIEIVKALEHGDSK